METMKVYHISMKDLGSRPDIYPSIPDTMSQCENSTTPRICVCPTIPGCIMAKELTHDLKSEDDVINFYVYEARILSDHIIQPTYADVFDAWYTGELWVTEPYTFELFGLYQLRKQMDVGESCYSRYSITNHYDKDGIIDRVKASPIYGDCICFSMIDSDKFKSV